jgi:hypothetical protein
MKNLIIALAFSIMATLGFAASAEARDFRCSGQTYYGDRLEVTGKFSGNRMIRDVYVTVNGDYLYYWDAPNVTISGTNTFWTVTGIEDDNTLVIRHPERVSNQTYMRIVIGGGYYADNEFNRATCTFRN